jgi:Transposase DNA-binding/Transposase Tn5 dimerisation domain
LTQDTDSDWALEEFGAAELGDARRTKRLVALARQLARSPHCSLPQSLSPAELKAGYRFFDNEEVDTDGILTAHIGQTLARMRQVPLILAVQDTTEYNLTHLPATAGLGYCSHKDVRGFFMHSMLALTPEGLPLGVLGLKTWTRPLEQLGKRGLRKKLPVQEKESVKWIEGLNQVVALKRHCPDTAVVTVCDREADLYDLFAAERAAGVEWLVRAAWNRGVDHPDKYLWEAMQSVAVMGTMPLHVPARMGAVERLAQLSVRCAPIRVRVPRSRKGKGLADVAVYAVWAIETAPPKGVEPLEWLLLTSVPTQTLEDALERLSWYARRWTIETWHRVLKSGCQIEARQFGDVQRFMRATALFAVIGWRLLYATLLGRLDAGISSAVLLQRFEWEALYCRTHGTTTPPPHPPTLGQAVLWIAKLGGYLGRKRDRPPGTTVLWRGFLALHETAQMYLIFRKRE